MVGFYPAWDFALTASDFSVCSNRKVTKRVPPLFVCPCGVPEFTSIAYEPALMRRPGAQS